MRAWLARWRSPLTLEAQDAYGLWAPSYPPRAHTPLMQIEERVVRELLPDVTGLRALDLACGSGRYLRLLADRGAQCLVGCDLAWGMLERAIAVSRAVAQADLFQLPFAASAFDLVVCGLALGDVVELRPAIAEIARVLRPGGLALWSDLHPDAAQHGWRRTFTGCDGRSYAIRHHVHSVAEHQAACCASGLAIEALREVLADQGPYVGRAAALVIRVRRA